MNSPAHHSSGIVVDFGTARASRGQYNLIACQYDGAVVHYLIMSDTQLADLLSEEGPQLRLFKMLKYARSDLALPDFSRFDYVIQFGKSAHQPAFTAAGDASPVSALQDV